MAILITFACLVIVIAAVFLVPALFNRYIAKHENAVLQRLAEAPVLAFDLKEQVGEGYDQSYHWQRMRGLEKRGLVYVLHLDGRMHYSLTPAGEEHVRDLRRKKA